MPSKSIRGVYKNLGDSEYTVTVEETVYFFSSILYMTKFKLDLEDNRRRFKTLLKQQRISFMYTDTIADFRLYMRTEKRGFCIFSKTNNIQYDNDNTYIKRLMNEWYGSSGIEY